MLVACAASVMAVVLAVAVIINIPINAQVAGWKAGSAPSAWTATRDRWLAAHWVRTAVGIGSFVIAAVAYRVV